MATSTARLESLPWLATLRARVTPAREAAVENGRIYALLAAAALALGALSLLYPSTPTYDPWAWIVWGREISHLDLQTTGGPSWKPLPVIFTTVFSLFGGAAPNLWLVVGRGGAILAVLLAFRLAWRLTGGREAPVAAAMAGLVGAVALIVSSQFVRTMSLGNSEGLLVAFALWGIERHLDGRYRQAFVLGFLAALLRPEVWLFVGVYGLWLLLIDRKALWLVVAVGVLIPALWFLPELWGSGNVWRAADRAQHPNSNSPAFAKHPFVKVIQDTWPLVITPVKAAAAFSLVLAAVQWLRRRREGAILAVGLLAFAWILLIAAMTQAGFSGNPRYIILGTSLLAVIGGVGFGRIVQFATGFVQRVAGPRLALAAGVVVFALLGLATVHWAKPRFQNFGKLDRALRYQAELRYDLRDALAKAGGAAGFRSCGQATAGKFSVPLVAWYLKVHTLDVGLVPAPQGELVAARTTNKQSLKPQPQQPYPPGYKPVARARTTTLFSTCPVRRPGPTPGA
jgi:MFS family permease